jgi:hypothetical protein
MAMSIPQADRFIGFDVEAGEYAAFYRGICIGHWPGYLSAEAALNRAELEQAAQDEHDAARLEAAAWLEQPVIVELVPAAGSELATLTAELDRLLFAA